MSVSCQYHELYAPDSAREWVFVELELYLSVMWYTALSSSSKFQSYATILLLLTSLSLVG